jgi:hypothetical protein
LIYLFSDESGDLIGRQDDYFILACVATNEPKHLRAAMRRARHAKQTRKEHAGAAEIKASHATDKFKSYFYRQLTKVDCELFCLYLKISDIPQALRPDTGLIFLRMTEQLLHLAGISAYRQVYFHKDRRSLKGLTTREYDTALKAVFLPHFKRPTRLEIFHQASHEDSGIQCADFICHAFYRKYRHHDEEWYRLISSKIAREENARDFL